MKCLHCAILEAVTQHIAEAAALGTPASGPQIMGAIGTVAGQFIAMADDPRARVGLALALNAAARAAMEQAGRPSGAPPPASQPAKAMH